uniref:F-box domain-containing protein n=1 Tax=Tetradesmus obliquus TaxID=3088 RepID=A0A383VU83_TETOB|eukprot:jgi/Sobl393_1/11775/SZX69058.1
MHSVLTVLGAEVGKHLGDVQNALPLRSVCKEWRDTATLSSTEADIDLSPGIFEDGASGNAKKQLFYRRCPRLRKLTYHVSPAVSLAKFEAALREASRRLTSLEELVLCFNNPAQQFETRQLAVLANLPMLKALTLQANFHPEACNFGVLGSLSSLSSLTVLPSEASTGLTDSHVASLGLLHGLASLEFPGHARAFTGSTLGALAALPRLSKLLITSNKPHSVDYTLELPALAGLRALTRRSSSAATPLHLELGVPDAAFGAALLRAVAGPGLGSVCIAVREAADSAAIAGLALAPGGKEKLAGLDLEFRAAPTPEDVAVLAGCGRLTRLHLSCKCPRAPAARVELAPWLALRQLQHLHLHINPAWRAPLQPATVAAMAEAWPTLSHLHLRLSPGDNATQALNQLGSFTCLKSLSLTWLGQAAPAAAAGAGGLTRRRSGSLEVPVLAVQHLPCSLEELSLTSISTVRLAVPSAAQRSTPALPQLRSLVLDGCFGLTDSLLQALVAAAPRLAALTLVLTGRQGLSSAGLAAVAAALPGLASLLLSDYREAPLCLSQASLAGLSGVVGLAQLRHLKLSTPDVVHAELLPSVFAGFSKLRRLDLVGCQDQAAAALGLVLPLCCIKHSPEWAADLVAAEAAA